MDLTTSIGMILFPFLAGTGFALGILITDSLKVPRKMRQVSETIIPLVCLAEVVGYASVFSCLLSYDRKRRAVSTCQLERFFPLIPLAGAGAGIIIPSFPILRKNYSAAVVFQKRKRVRDIDYFIQEPDENYISRLPDDILCHIISYFDRKDEAQTFVLWRRWRRIYYILLANPKFECHKMIEFATLTEHNSCLRKDNQRFVTAVDEMFELVSLIMHGNCHCNDKQSFITAVDTFLRLRTFLPMESFTLRFSLRRGFSGHLQRWLDCIVRTSVLRKLDINFCCDNELRRIPSSQLIVFPFKVLSSACMLEYVKLSFCVLEPNCQGPFNSLKELSLDGVPLVNGEVESILSCCPDLQSLSLRVIEGSLDLRDILSMIVVCPNLSKFVFSFRLCSLRYTERDAEESLMCVSLKLVVLDGFNFDAAQMKFASQRIRCAPALKQLTFLKK